MDVYSLVDIVPGDSNSFKIENLPSGTSFKFRVYFILVQLIAINAAGQSPHSLPSEVISTEEEIEEALTTNVTIELLNVEPVEGLMKLYPLQKKYILK